MYILGTAYLVGESKLKKWASIGIDISIACFEPPVRVMKAQNLFHLSNIIKLFVDKNRKKFHWNWIVCASMTILLWKHSFYSLWTWKLKILKKIHFEFCGQLWIGWKYKFFIYIEEIIKCEKNLVIKTFTLI